MLVFAEFPVAIAFLMSTLNTIQKIIDKNHNWEQDIESNLQQILNKLKEKQRFEPLLLKTIQELQDEKFYVASYQRSYKWSVKQVEQLLDDIHEFELGKNGEFYCLQPVVVKEKRSSSNEGIVWELIDGQQRITTIFIILKYLQQKSNDFFHLEYATRADSQNFLNYYLAEVTATDSYDQFVKNLERKYHKIIDHIDHFYFFQAYQTVINWFNRYNQHSEVIEAWRHKLLHHTKIIWYNVSDQLKASSDIKEEQHSIQIFLRLNQGKIPLTQAELIKALFLQRIAKTECEELSAKKTQQEVASQWDRMEQELQNKEFWSFIYPEQKNLPFTRIEVLFELVISKNTKKCEDYDLFIQCQELIENHGVKYVWRQVQECFFRLVEWYRNPRLYHMTGFLITQNLMKIQEIWVLSQNHTRREFETELVKKISKILGQYFKDEKVLSFNHLQYTSSTLKKINSVLLLFNIYLHEKQNTLLPFHLYRQVSWDIEHIHAQQSPEAPNEKKIFYDEHKKFLSGCCLGSLSEEDRLSLHTLLEGWYQCFSDPKHNIEQEKQKLTAYHQLVNHLFGETNVNTLDNLCLLPQKINRSIGNDMFPFKRSKIISKQLSLMQQDDLTDKQQTELTKKWFIPLGSQYVFSKYFSEDTDDMIRWGLNDRKAYASAIMKCLKSYGIDLED